MEKTISTKTSLQDYENVDDVNRQLERMGYNIGVRIIEDFLARTGSGRCNDFRDTSEKVPKNPKFHRFGHTMFLHLTPGAAGVQDFLECDPHSHELVFGIKKMKFYLLNFIPRQVTSSL